MSESNSYHILYTSLNLPSDLMEKMIRLQREQRLSVSQVASAAVTQYLSNLPAEATHFCQECNAFLPEADFYLKNGKPFRVCKEHHKARNARWYQKNKRILGERYQRNYQRKKAMA